MATPSVDASGWRYGDWYILGANRIWKARVSFHAVPCWQWHQTAFTTAGMLFFDRPRPWWQRGVLRWCDVCGGR